jgi:hypothetical protein
MEKHEAYTGGELAALLELIFKNLNTNLEPFSSFQAQLDISEYVGQTVDFHRAMTAIKELYRLKPHVVDSLHFSVRAILQELDQTGLWKSDKFVHPVHIKTLCDSPV